MRLPACASLRHAKGVPERTESITPFPISVYVLVGIGKAVPIWQACLWPLPPERPVHKLGLSGRAKPDEPGIWAKSDLRRLPLKRVRVCRRLDSRRPSGVSVEPEGDHGDAGRHDLRRTCLSNGLASGMSEHDVVVLAGHSSFSTTHESWPFAGISWIGSTRPPILGVHLSRAPDLGRRELTINQRSC